MKDHNLRLLLVEDSHLFRTRFLDAVSEIGGIDVVGNAENVTDALKSVREHNPDVIILDVHLKEGTGFEVLRNVRAGSGSHVIIMLTGDPSEHYRRISTTMGADFYFQKANEFDDVLDLLRRMTAGN